MKLTGQRFGRLTVVALHPKRTCRGQVRWLCQCDCGKRKVVNEIGLRVGGTISCGCWNPVLAGTREYSVWNGMLNRCRSPNNPSYPSYGGRGITVCDRWLY